MKQSCGIKNIRNILIKNVCSQLLYSYLIKRKHKRKKKIYRIKGYFNRVLLEQKTLSQLSNFMVF